MKKIIAGLSVGLMLTTIGCSEAEIIESAAQQGNSLNYSVLVGAASRTAEFGVGDFATGDQFKLNAYQEKSGWNPYFNENLVRTTTGWSLEGNPRYASPYATRFYAVYPEVAGRIAYQEGGVNFDTTYPSVRVTSQFDADGNYQMEDLLISSSKLAAGVKNVGLSFDHALANVNFAILGCKDVKITVESISLEEVALAGTFNFADSDVAAPVARHGSWSIDATGTIPYQFAGTNFTTTGLDGDMPYAFGDGGNFSAGNVSYVALDGAVRTKAEMQAAALTLENAVMMLPLAANDIATATMKVKFSATDMNNHIIGDSENNKPVFERVIKLSDLVAEIAGGKRYLFTLAPKFDGQKLSFSVTVNDWENEAPINPGIIDNKKVKITFPDEVDGSYTLPTEGLSAIGDEVELLFSDNKFSNPLTINIPENVPANIQTLVVSLAEATRYGAPLNVVLNANAFAGTIRFVDVENNLPVALSSLVVTAPNATVLLENQNVTGHVVVNAVSDNTFIVAKDTRIQGDLTSYVGNVEVYGAVVGNFNAHAGYAKVYGEVGKINIFGDNTAVYVKNEKVGNELHGFLFESNNVSNKKFTNFAGISLFEMIQNTAGQSLDKFLEFLTAIAGVAGDASGQDLSFLEAIFNGITGIDISSLDDLLGTKFHYAGVNANFSNNYVTFSNKGSLQKVQYSLHNSTAASGYLATLDRALYDTPVLDLVEMHKPYMIAAHKVLGIFVDLPSIENINAIPTVYPATNNFSMEGIINLLNIVKQVADLLDSINELGAAEMIQAVYDGSYFTEANFKKEIANRGYLAILADVASINVAASSNFTFNTMGGKKTIQNYANAHCVNPPVINSREDGTALANALNSILPGLTIKAGIDLAISASGDEIPQEIIDLVLANLTTITEIFDVFMNYFDPIYDATVQIDNAIKTVQSYNPWKYDKQGGAFTKESELVGLGAFYELNCNGQVITITSAHTSVE